MTELSIPTGRATKAGFPEHRSLDTRAILVDTNGTAWIVSGGPASHGLRPADPGELAAVASHFGGKWLNAVERMTALAD